MTRKEFSEMVAERPFILDGATGSNLLNMGMPRGIPTELWIYDHPEAVIELQKRYIEAGSMAVLAPTFQTNQIAFRGYHIPESELKAKVHDCIAASVRASRKAADGRALVAGDLGGCGQYLAPVGKLTYEEAYDCYADQIETICEAGVDYLAIETMLSLDDTAVILDAARNICDLPVIATLTCEADGSLFFGGNIFDAVEGVASMGADAVGCNCSVGPDQLESIIRNMASLVSVPVIAKPNAGLPEINAQGQAIYSMGPSEFAKAMMVLKEAGASILGGCCGTSPEYIRALVEEIGE